MKFLLAALLLLSTSLHAQSDLKFEHGLPDSEDKWVAFPADKDGNYNYGFVYIDAQAGPTLNHEGKFKISSQGTFIPEKAKNAMVKIRLQASPAKVAFIPAAKLAELRQPATPEWLSVYKSDTTSAKHFYQWGFFYNGWGASDKALTFLSKAQALDPNYQGLDLEMGYAYNALEQYDKAISALTRALTTSSDQCYLYKELSFAEMHAGQLDKAAQTCKKGLAACSDNAIKSEIAYNLAFQFFERQDKANYKYWSGEARKWATKGDQISQALHQLDEISRK
ncbi:hypothetical protein [Hymenobacter cellulosilyticus]|uniref:Tetratricopeptide repeat protein n=1 Tax=Hymenobacter cellulosilyticus TaxID=2932248 RepID=A0A8T9Q5W3_9BACT|nr:hypothetical protein [Hymenobacter cellulosilyticus]UOQ71811.1 hypothetical protein MUN79_24945 [Hymenobacter cellulosilyticus]